MPAFTPARLTSFLTVWSVTGPPRSRWREAGQLSAVLRSWRVTALVGLSGVLGSFCWFMAFTLQNAAYVKALGQIELVFTFLASCLVFKEKSSAREMIGIALVVASILLLVLLL